MLVISSSIILRTKLLIFFSTRPKNVFNRNNKYYFRIELTRPSSTLGGRLRNLTSRRTKIKCTTIIYYYTRYQWLKILKIEHRKSTKRSITCSTIITVFFFFFGHIYVFSQNNTTYVILYFQTNHEALLF